MWSWLLALLSSCARISEGSRHNGPSDVLALAEEDWAPQAKRIFRQLLDQTVRRRGDAGDTNDLLLAILTAFPDRVAKRRQDDELQLSSGGSARLARSSCVREQLMVAVEIEERREQGLPLVRLASAIEPEWLLDLFPERLRSRAALEWNRAAERVEAANALLYDSLVIEESRGQRPDPIAASRLLFERAVEAGVARFADEAEISAFLARVRFAVEHGAPCGALSESDVMAALESLCAGLRSFSELENAGRSGGLLRAIELRLQPAAARTVEEIAPASLKLPSGRRAKIHYEPGKPPWVASRLQDFFGLRQSPSYRARRGASVLHLLAPNQRPVQMTYRSGRFLGAPAIPQVRRELSRRYPRQ